MGALKSALPPSPGVALCYTLLHVFDSGNLRALLRGNFGWHLDLLTLGLSMYSYQGNQVSPGDRREAWNGRWGESLPFSPPGPYWPECVTAPNLS